MDKEFDHEPDSEDLIPTELAGGPNVEDQDSFVVRPNLTSIGRYQVLKQLGRGGFGFVYQADDPVLRRKVAIKVPRWDKPISRKAIDNFLKEGQMLAQVDHPGIVSVFDHGVTEDGIPFVVMQYVEGNTLSEILKDGPLEPKTAVEFLIRVASALQAAHKKTLTHRDLKPANIIIDEQGEVHLVDFGLALHDDLMPQETSAETAGTPSWMSPEQVRGENHLIDGQTDIWALGIIMYQSLVGRLPFKGGSGKELARAICYRNPKPLRQLKESIPRELERICLRCLQKLMDDRYHSMQDVIEELGAWIADGARVGDQATGKTDATSIHTIQMLQTVSKNTVNSHGQTPNESPSDRSNGQTSGSRNSANRTDVQTLEIVPKGLRAFDQNDAGFFLQLLPGPTDRNGVPESIRFWIARLDVSCQVEKIPVGLIYGPSGSGKSSFVRAGLIPHLNSRVIPIYIDCTTNDIVSSVKNNLCNEFHEISPETGLVAMLRQIRLGGVLKQGDKLLLILDQFEQWLSNTGDLRQHQLTEALRQCDSETVQALLLVRDEFWLSASGFLHLIGQKIEEGKNACALPLCDESHARNILAAMGHALGKFPAANTLTPKQKRFLKECIKSISQNGHVIFLHISLLTEILEDTEWNLDHHKLALDWNTIGRRYLESVFGHSRPKAINRAIEDCSRTILSELLPGPGESLKNIGRNRAELLASTNLEHNKEMLDTVLGFLQNHAKLVGQQERCPESEGSNIAVFQLAHDLLVAPIREWLDAKRKSNWRGRSQIRFDEIYSQWRSSGQRKITAGFWESPWLLLANRSASNSSDKRQLSRKIGTTFLAKFAVGFAFVALIAGAFLVQQELTASHVLAERLARVIESPPAAFEHSMPQLIDLTSSAKIRAALGSFHDSDVRMKMRKLMILSGSGRISDEELSELVGLVALAQGNECPNFTNALRSAGFDRSDPLLEKSCAESADRQVKCRIAILRAHLAGGSDGSFCLPEPPDIDFRTEFADTLRYWHGPDRELADVLRGCQNSLERMAWCKGIGLVPSSEFDRSSIEHLGIVLSNLVNEDPDSGVHECSKLALRKLKLDLPLIPPDSLARKLTDQTDNGRDWIELELAPGITVTMARVAAGKVPLGAGSSYGKERYGNIDPEVRHDFFVSTTEVTAELFRLFVDSGELTDEEVTFFKSHPAMTSKLKGQLPISRVKWTEAARFCNWLGRQHGLNEVYLENDGKWTRDPMLKGFRLPTVLEWELAARGGTQTTYFFGGPGQIERFPEYVVGATDALPVAGLDVGICGSKFPNDFGLYDVMGNAFEWTDDSFPNEYSQGISGQDRTVRGNRAQGPSQFFRLAEYFPLEIDSRPLANVTEAGFRIVLDADSLSRD